MKRQASYPAPENCAVNEETGDGRAVGRCWHHAPGDVCPRHGNVAEVNAPKVWYVCHHCLQDPQAKQVGFQTPDQAPPSCRPHLQAVKLTRPRVPRWRRAGRR